MAKPIAVQTSDTLEASCWCVTYMHRYMAGEYAPHYPVPVALPERTPGTWDDVRAAQRFFVSPDGSGGINWTWAYFLTESDAIGFDTWCGHHGYETRGVYPPHRDCYYGVRYR